MEKWVHTLQPFTGVKNMAKKMVEISATELKKLKAKIERENERKNAKKNNRAFDGFGSFMQQKMTSTIRDCWRQSSAARKIVVKRTDLGNGFSRCEHGACKNKKHPHTFIDHIVPCGSVTEANYLQRMNCPSTGLQALCKFHHDEKTKLERKHAALKKRARPGIDFY